MLRLEYSSVDAIAVDAMAHCGDINDNSIDCEGYTFFIEEIYHSPLTLSLECESSYVWKDSIYIDTGCALTCKSGLNILECRMTCGTPDHAMNQLWSGRRTATALTAPAW